MAKVYEYKGLSYELPDGLTNEDALARIKASLGETETPGVGAQLRRAAGLGARAIVEGLSAPSNIVTDFGAGLLNLGAQAVGSERRVPRLSQLQSQALTDLGAPVPETLTERAVQMGMEGLVSGAGLARALPTTIFGQDLARQLPAATVAPAVAQPVAEVVQESTDSELAALVASVGISGAVGKKSGDIADRVIAGKQPVTTMGEVRQNAQRSYTKVSDLGIKLTPANTKSLIDKLETRLDAKDYIPENAAPVKNVLADIKRIAKRGDVSFDNVDKMRSLALTLKGNPDANVRRLGGELTAGIDEHVAALSPRDVKAGAGGIDEAVKTIASARKDWRNLSRASMLENILDIAEARAINPTSSESELIRQGFITLAANKNKMALFNEAERNAIRSVAKGGSLDPLLTMLAKFNPQRSQLIAGGTLGFGIGDVGSLKYTIPTAAAGFAADKAQALLRRREAEQTMSGLLTGTTRAAPPSQFNRGLLSTLLVQPTPQLDLVVEPTITPQGR